MSIDAWKKAKIATASAKAYLALIGKPSEYATAKHYGELSKFSISTEIHFQPSDGARNYHDCKEFDAALTTVVREKWGILRDEAVELLVKEEAKAAVAAKETVESLMREIEEAQATAG